MGMHLVDEVMVEEEEEEIDEDLLILMQDGDEDIDDSPDPILDWEPLVEIPILDDAPQWSLIWRISGAHFWGYGLPSSNDIT